MKFLRYLWWEWVAPLGMGACIGLLFWAAIIR